MNRKAIMNRQRSLDIQLDKVGISQWKNLYYNLSFEELFEHEMNPRLQGYDKALLTEFGAVTVDTGRFTGRSPKDKYIVDEPSSRDKIWWQGHEIPGSDNKRLSQHAWEHLKVLSVQQLIGKNLYIMDGFCGANEDSRLKVRLITEVAWMAHFFKNMFIRPTEEELRNFQPDWTILNACKTTCPDYAQYGLRSEVFVAFHLAEKMTCIGGTWYGGEIKKGIFSIMNYFLPLKGIGSFHCSANRAAQGDVALFFGLSGTGKTTLSTDPKRELIGDDEHGWDEDGIFNFEGGCYAKCINLTREKEPGIYNAIRRNALLENVDLDPLTGKVDYFSKKKTENTRVSYPIDHIENIVRPVSKGDHPKTIIFLTCDAYGILPPVAKLTPEQAMYHYLSGYTAKIAGTELGVTEPKATFSACFGQAFLLLHPTVYADILGNKMRERGSQAFLINTGWIRGQYGMGERIPLNDNRTTLDHIFSGIIDEVQYEIMPLFNLQIPKSLPDMDPTILNPRKAWADKAAYDATAKKLAQMFIDNFKKFTHTSEGKALEAAGPRL